ncbi:DUF3880 domain-containing protein [Cohnella lubricantis]|nr:DUF3880 domain-containing protein [Cohnella lubricantis]MBP2120351.1 spore maturation protein CgeB [Cohnella lubricantis]
MRYRRKENPRDKGRSAGLQDGRLDGWRVGAAQGITDYTPLPAPRSDLRVMYVPQGFEAIDQGVIWALEQSVAQLTVAPADRMRATAEQIRPDAVLVMNGLHVFPPDHLAQVQAIRQMGILTAIWFVDDPYVSDDTPSIGVNYDVVFTHERKCVPMYGSAGCPNVYQLPLAVNPQVFRPMQVPPQYRSDICFIGMGFWNRIRLFNELVDYLKHKRVFLAGGLWERMPRFAELNPFIHAGWIPVSETVKYYNGAKIVINIHRTTEAGEDNRNSGNWGAESINPRTYEIAACGALQLTDSRLELPEQYEVGAEIASFQTSDQLISLIEHYLTHEEERRRMAVRSFKRTYRQHTFLHRIDSLLRVLESHKK